MDFQTANRRREVRFLDPESPRLDCQIDTLVYELYGLTPEEIDLVEGNAPAGKEPADD